MEPIPSMMPTNPADGAGPAGPSAPESAPAGGPRWLRPLHWVSDPSSPRWIWVVVGLYLLSTVALSFAEFWMERSRERQRIDATMEAAGYALDQILGVDFHDRYNLQHPIDSAEYARLVHELNRFAGRLRLEYVYSMVRIDGGVRFVVSNETRGDTLRGTPSRFYNHYPKPPEALVQAFDADDDTHRFAWYTNIWDSYYSVFIPRRSPGGVRYILAADLKLADYRTLLAHCLGRSAFLVFLMLVPLLPLLYFQRRLLRARMEMAERDRAYAADLAILNGRLEERVGERTEELRKAMEDLKRFSYVVSHDLNAPLHAISGFAQILADEASGNLTADQLNLLGTITASAGRMSTMIRTILYESTDRDDVMRRETVDLSAMAGEVAEELRAANMGYGARLEIAPGLKVSGEPSMVRLVLQNLLSNAFKYSRQNPSPMVVVSGGTEGNADWFEVRDNGVGFDPELADRLFRPFERLHGDRFEGHGIGLTHVARILERHGGRIDAVGRPGEGAVFRVTLPRAVGKAGETGSAT
ncbi:MAG TPA: ATP-binding protein [Fibrobacteria bacterium]|nr:ATP-binding protein [Fibrobacteria bacterium]